MTILEWLGLAASGLGLFYYGVRFAAWLDARVSAGVDSAGQEALCEPLPEIPSDSFAD